MVAAPVVLITALAIVSGSPAENSAELCRQIVSRTAAAANARRGAIQRIVEHAGSPDAAFLNGCLSMSEGAYDRAVAFFEVAAAEPHSLYYLWLGRAYGMQARSANVFRQPFLARKTRVTFERAVALDGGNLDARADLALYYQRAPGVLGGSKTRAREQLQEIYKRNEYRGAVAESATLLAASDTTAAIALYAGLTRGAPDSAQAWQALIAIHMRRGKWQDAFAVNREMQKVASLSLPALYELGRIAAASGIETLEGERALRLFLGADEVPAAPSHASANYQLGEILQRRKDIEGARAAYSAALRLEPGYNAAKRALEALK